MQIEDIRDEIDAINKKFNNIIIYKDFNIQEKVDVISTGSIGLDWKTCIGGIPKGRVTEIIGAESSGKTSLCGCIIANANKAGGMAAMIDAEHDVDLNYYKNLGVNLDQTVIAQPDSMEDALALTENLLELNKFSVIVFDSVAALSTRAELEGEIDDQQMGDKARLMGKSLRRITSILGKTNTAIVFVNQLRDNINKFGYGPSTVTPAGRALKFKASLRISLAIETSQVEQGGVPIGSRIKAKIIKNKVGAPFGEWSFTLVWGKGIVEEIDILEVGTELGIISKKGSWYSYGDIQLGQGLFKSGDMLKLNPELIEKIKNDIWALIKN